MKEKHENVLYPLIKRSVLVIAFAFLLCLCMPPVRTYAAGKAVKVKYKYKYSNDKEKLIVKGIDKNKKTAWTYTTKYCESTQYSQLFGTEKRNRVYVFESRKLVALRKRDGKRIWTCKNIQLAGLVLTADSSNNVYVAGTDGGLVYKINSKGKIVWKKDISISGCDGAYKLTVKNGKLTILYDEEHACKMVLNSKNGKMIKK